MGRERDIHHYVISELRRLHQGDYPRPQEDWDLLWVLSGPEVTLEEQNALNGNETRDRITTGIKVSKQITTLRGGNPDKLSDIQRLGSPIYYNGPNEHNRYLLTERENGIFETKFHFPREKMIIAPADVGVIHTGHQFSLFPAKLLDNVRKVAIISSARHLPRCALYLGLPNTPFFTRSREEIILYPAQPVEFPIGPTKAEVKKIAPYIAQGFLADIPR